MHSVIIKNKIISISVLVSILLYVTISMLPTTLLAQTPETWVHNGNFEEGLRYWRSVENTTLTAGRTGQGIKVDYDNGNSDILQELSTTFLAGKTYQASAWCKTTLDSKCKIFLGDANSGYENSDSRIVRGTSEWQPINVIVTPEKNELLSVWLHSQETATSVFYDDVIVKELNCPAEQLCNTGFESNIDYWDIGIGSQTVSPGFQGQSALKSVQWAESSERPNWEGVAQRFQVRQGEIYQVSAYLKWDYAIQVHMNVAWFDASGKSLGNAEQILGDSATNSGGWVLKQALMTTPFEAAFAKIIIWHGVDQKGTVNVKGSTLWIDDVTVSKYPTGQSNNLLINSDFENGTDGWQITGQANLVSGSNGGQALQSIQTLTPQNDALWHGLKQRIDVVGNQPYLFSTAISDTNTTGSHMKVVWFNAANHIVGQDSDEYWARGTSNGWIKRTQKFVARPDAVSAEVELLHGVTKNTSGNFENVPGSIVLYDDLYFGETTCSTNLVCNPDFEEGFHFWRSTGNAELVTGRTGQGIRISYDKHLDSENNADIFQVLPRMFQANKNYRISVWCKANSGTYCDLFVGDVESGYENTVAVFKDGNGDWQQLIAELTLSKDELLSLYLYSKSENATVIYDDLELMATSSSPQCHELILTHIGLGTDPIATPTHSDGCPEHKYNAGESISLAASPEDNWQVESWYGTNNNNSKALINSIIMPDSPHSASVTYSVIPSRPWVIMIYLNGDNDLEQWTTSLFNRLELSVSRNPSLIVRVLWDRRGKGDTRLYEVLPDNNPTEFANYEDRLNEKMWVLDELDMGSPLTLLNFITTTRTTLPAQNYLLSIVDHGGGWSPELRDSQQSLTRFAAGASGLSWDETDNSYLSTRDMGIIFKNPHLQNDPLDIVFYDACLMSMVEEMYEIYGGANYMLASQYETWTSFPYDEYLMGINDRSSREQAIWMVDKYFASLEGYPRTMSAIDIQYAGALAGSINELAHSLLNKLQGSEISLRRVFSSTQKLDYDYDKIIRPQEGFIDLGDFADRLFDEFDDIEVRGAAQKIQEILQGSRGPLIMYERHKSNPLKGKTKLVPLDNVTGLSIYLPLGENDPDLPFYRQSDEALNNQFVKDTVWNDLIINLVEIDGGPCSQPCVGGRGNQPHPIITDEKIFLPLIVNN